MPDSAPDPFLRSSIRKMVVGAATFALVCVVAVVGYVAAGWSVGDAVYMVVISIFGVGYGEVNPVSTPALRVLTMGVIVVGYGAVIYAVGGFIQLVVDGELNRALGARRMTREIDRLEGHAIICGFGRMGTTLARELAAAGRPFVAIDTHGGNPSLDDVLVIEGDATDEAVLEAAGIRRAAVLASVLSDDATNVFVTLTAREMNPDLVILARGENPHTESKLRSCGATTVVSPTTIGANKIAQLIIRPTADQVLDLLTAEGDSGLDLTQVGLEFDEVPIDEGSPLADRTLAEIEVKGAHGYLIVGIRGADGRTLMHPPSTKRLAVGDVVVVLGYHDDIPRLAARFAPSAPRGQTYRGAPLQG